MNSDATTATTLQTLPGAIILAAVLVLPARAEPELPLADPSVKDEVTAVIHRMGEIFTKLDGPQPITLFDPDEPAPQYLGEEMPDWMIGWEPLRWYFNTPERFAVVEAMDYFPSNIRVRSLTPDLALATWNVKAEMKFRRGPPMGESLRANAVLRRTAEGWRFIYYAEAPKSTMTYIRDLYESQASPEFRQRFKPPEPGDPLGEIPPASGSTPGPGSGAN